MRYFGWPISGIKRVIAISGSSNDAVGVSECLL